MLEFNRAVATSATPINNSIIRIEIKSTPMKGILLPTFFQTLKINTFCKNRKNTLLVNCTVNNAVYDNNTIPYYIPVASSVSLSGIVAIRNNFKIKTGTKLI